MPVMDRERWQTLGPLLDEALDLPPEDRATWLDALRTTSPNVAAELSLLLNGEQLADGTGFLKRPETVSLAGLDLGGWTLERLLGHGGMGSVWLARRSDGRFEGTAAVKLLNLALVSEAGQARFRREGSALARLTHPAIARLLDAGVSPSGQPYLVLEHVDGRPIDAYVAQQRLTMDARVRLFLQVLEAVGHAHACLVVHRDLKPTNILVTPDGTVKLLDFGIAKLLDQGGDVGLTALDDRAKEVSHDAPTADLGRALTPEFASPEQAVGAAITTAADVYAAGVLLYTLLSGRHPTAEGCRTTTEVLAALQERDAAPLGLGDLDAILAQALRKQPAERYRTAAAFADDLGRWLHHEPVAARRQSLGYRARKLLRRHRAASAALVATMAVSAVYVGVVVRDRIRLRAALAESETNAARADQVTNFAVGLFEASEGGAAYADSLSARELLTRAIDRAHEFAGQPLIEAQMLDLIGRIRDRIGDHAAARTVLAEALAIRQRQLGDDHPDVATSLMNLADAVSSMDRDAKIAVPMLRRALDIRQGLYGPGDPRTADALYSLATAIHMGGDYRGAKPLFDQWMATTQRQPPPLTPQRAEQLRTLSRIFHFSHRLPDAERVSRQTIALMTAIYGPTHSRVGMELSHLGSILDEEGDHATADSVSHAAVAMLRRAYPSGSLDLANALRNLGFQLTNAGQLEEAEQVWREAADLFARDAGTENGNYANAMSQLGRAQLQRGHFADAERTLRRVLAIKFPNLTLNNPVLGRTRLYLGETLVAEGQLGEAEPMLLDVLHRAETLPLEAGARRRAAQALVRLYEAEARPVEAAQYRAIVAAATGVPPSAK